MVISSVVGTWLSTSCYCLLPPVGVGLIESLQRGPSRAGWHMVDPRRRRTASALFSSLWTVDDTSTKQLSPSATRALHHTHGVVG